MKTPKTKICTKCGGEKSIEEYSPVKHYSFKKKQVSWKRQAQCRDCMAIYKSVYNQVNRNHISEKAKEYRGKNKDILAAKKKIYQEVNKEKVAAYKSKNRTSVEEKARRDELAEIRHRAFLEEYKKEEEKRLKEMLLSKKKVLYKKRRIARKKWWEKNKEKYRLLNRDPVEQKKARDYNKRYSEKLPDAFVRNRLRQGTILEIGDIPQELIDVKREHIKLSRKLRKAQ